jgi:hypothetical protein
MEFSKPPIFTALHRSRQALLSSNNRGFPHTNKRADELAICSLYHLLQFGIASENRFRISRLLDSGWFDFDVFKTSAAHLQSVV